MEYIYVCPKCGATYGLKSEAEQKSCSSCNMELIYTGETDESWKALSRDKKESIKKYGIIKSQEQIAREQEERERRDRIIEQQKQTFAKEDGEFYEYDVVTVLNEGHGRVDREYMLSILAEHAKAGWRLHTIYSNELGKNAILGINSTACEDVLIFERRIEKFYE